VALNVYRFHGWVTFLDPTKDREKEVERGMVVPIGKAGRFSETTPAAAAILQ
jgi:hypothetical protein